jgi:tRNA/tmRNA/rRNA uracil-C5-methylase (TrmA/RlmC/RlmD family)
MKQQFGVEETQLFVNDVRAFVDLIDTSLQSLTIEECLTISDELDLAIKDLRLVFDELRNKVAKTMESRDEKEATIAMPDGSQVLVVRDWRISRTKVKTDELVEEVRRRATDLERRLDKDTGEVVNEKDAELDAYRKAFRFEPRWSAIKELGINDDEYCEKKFQSTIKVTKGMS